MSKFLFLCEFVLLYSQLNTTYCELLTNLYGSSLNFGNFRDSSSQITTEEYQTQFKKLTTTSVYKKFERPGYGQNQSLPVYVNISLDMLALSSFDEINFECTIFLIMDEEWFDPRLSYESNQTEAREIDVNIYDRLWCPRLRVPNVREPGSGIVELNGGSNMMVFKTRPDGYVFMRSNFKLNLFCLMNFKDYPFDVQKCSIKIQSSELNIDELIIQWSEDNPFKNSDRFQLAGFGLQDYRLFNETVQFDHKSGNLSRLKVELHFKRNWFHFLLEIYLPSGLFVAMSWLSFWLEISATPARVTLGMTAMLTLITNSMFSRDKLPKIPYIHAMDLWIAFCICFVFASLIEYTFVSYLYQTDKHKRERQKSIQRDLSALSLASMATTTISQYLDVPEPPKNKLSLTIPDLAADLRRLSAVSGSISDCSSETGILNKYSGGKRQPFLKRLIQIKCSNQELAQKIDQKCRFIFPLCFVLFNIIYWTSVGV